MERENSRQEGGGNTRDDGSEVPGIPLGLSTSPKKESHQRGNEGAGIFNWRAGRGAV